MASSIWLLVEWIEDDVFSSFSVVNYDSVVNKTSALEPGNMVYVRENYQDNPRQGKIMRISESKLYVQEHKEILERQNQQYKCMLKQCLQNIKDMKAGNAVTNCAPYTPQLVNNQVAPVHIPTNSTVSVRNNIIEPEFLHRTQEVAVQNVDYSTPRVRNREPTTRPMRYLPDQAPERSEHPLRSSTPLPVSSTLREDHSKVYIDKACQTNDIFQEPLKKVEKMEGLLNKLYGVFHGLIEQVTFNIEDFDDASLLESGHHTSTTEYNNTDDEGSEVENVRNTVRVRDGNDVRQSHNNSATAEDLSSRVLRVRRMSAQSTSNAIDTDMVPIGDGNAMVPKRVLNSIKWNSHTSATRQLLQAVFPRSVLATHCLTGKRSPAFMNRPAKKILDPKLVEDIVKIVSTRCRVPKSLVRNSITIKCTDEAKLYRNRQAYKQQRKKAPNDENRPPSSLSSDESNTLTN